MNEKTIVYHKNYKSHKNLIANMPNMQMPLTSRHPDLNPLMKLPLQTI